MADTRHRLLDAAIHEIGGRGLDGATTRDIARRAGTNLQAILYHFGSKEGLHRAAGKHIAERMSAALADALTDGQDTARESISKDEAFKRLYNLVTSVLDFYLGEDSARFAQFAVREQLHPTAAFDSLNASVIKPLLATVRNLLAVLRDEDPNSETIGLLAVSLLGSVLVFRVAHTTAMEELEWHHVGNDERSRAHQHAALLVQSVTKYQGGAIDAWN